MITRVLLVLMILSMSVCAFAGEDVQLLNSAGAPIGKNAIDSVDINQTCGGCHEVSDYAQSVHFNREDTSGEAEANCLDCHLGKTTLSGVIVKTPASPKNASCLTCHSEYEMWGDKADVHGNMDCYDCHQNAGHKKTGAASCSGCHLDKKTKAPHPSHIGFSRLHMKRIACQTCHIRKDVFGDGKDLGHTQIDKVIFPLNESGTVINHGVTDVKNALGEGALFPRTGCNDCHSTKSPFFFKTSATNKTDDEGNIIKIQSYKTYGISRADIFVGAIRERFLKPYSLWLFIFMIVMSLAHYVIFGPRRVPVTCETPNIVRFTLLERLVHFLAIFSFLILGGTGIVFLWRLETPAGVLRTIHGFAGPLFIAAIIGIFIVWWKNALFVSCDKDWVCKMGGYLWMRGHCPAEKFNAGQKMFYWGVVIIAGSVLCITGIMLILGRGNASPWIFTIHDAASLALIAGILGHVYLSVFANPGTISGVLTGKVCKAWAEHHHPDWLHRQEHLEQESSE